jgi:hypothetical protein
MSTETARISASESRPSSPSALHRSSAIRSTAAWRLAGGSRAARVAFALSLGMLIALTSRALCAPPALAKPTPKLPSDRDLVDEYAAVEGAQLAEVLPGGPEKFISAIDSSKYNLIVHAYGKTYAAAANTECAYDSSEDEPIHCRITIYREAHKNNNEYLRGVVAHEVFHVFEARMSGSESHFNSEGGWLVEGAADWVESVLVERDPNAHEIWRDYLLSPQTPLFSRVYDAVGFFGHMESTEISPWKRFKAIFKATSDTAAYTAAIGTSKPFLDSEASVFFRAAAFGAEWDARGRNVPSAHEVGFKPTPVNVTTKIHPKLVVKPYADGAYDLSIAALPAATPVAELVVVKGNVRLRSTSGGEVNAIDPTQILLCSDPKGCNCPSRPSHFEQFKTGDLAITGATTGAEVRITPRKPCEVLLPGRSCEGLLPGFNVPVHEAIKNLIGQAPSAESKMGASAVSICLFLAKGNYISNAEGEQTFDGVIAASVSVQSFPSIALATENFKRIPAFPKFLISHPSVGEEADLFTGETNGGSGIEYASDGAVRVHNVIAQFIIVGTPGNTEANPQASLALLSVVASEI